MKTYKDAKKLNEDLQKTSGSIGMFIMAEHSEGLHAGHRAMISQMKATYDNVVLGLGAMVRLNAPLAPDFKERATFDLLVNNTFEIKTKSMVADDVDFFITRPYPKDDYNAVIETVLANPAYMEWLLSHGLEKQRYTLNSFYGMRFIEQCLGGLDDATINGSMKDIFFKRIVTSIYNLMYPEGTLKHASLPMVRDVNGLTLEAIAVPELLEARIALESLVKAYKGNSITELNKEIDRFVVPLLPEGYSIPGAQAWNIEDITCLDDDRIPTEKKCQLWIRIGSRTKNENHYDCIRFYNIDETKKYESNTLLEVE